MYYPVFLDLTGEPCLVVGGGEIARRKARALLRAGARVTLVAPRLDPGVRKLRVRRIRRKFRSGDVRGAALVVSATNDPDVNRSVFRACRRRRIPVNVVDVPELCRFIVPAVVRRGPVVVAVSTGGASPGLAKALRQELERIFPVTLGPLARKLGKARKAIMKKLPPSPARARKLKGLLRGLRPLRARAR